ncbi:MAG: amidase [Bacteroidales bacterium]|nr:amidase [Bacteroidales bacterium]
MKRFQSIYVLVLIVLSISSCIPGNDGKNDNISVHNFKFQEFTILEISEGYKNKDFTVQEVVQSYLERIEAIDKNGPGLHSVLQVNPDAIEIAKKLDQDLEEGISRGPLHGIPVLLKDNIDTHDEMETTAGSRALTGSHPLQDSWVAMKLREAGAVILGKTNLSEWANFRGELSSSGWSGVGGQTRNPYIIDRNPCGSSSGSGVAVSSNLCMVAIGTETNGSIVCPSTVNGIVGIKPTVGLISRSGIIPISFTQDTPGPMARTVTDAAICLGAMVGIDTPDSKTSFSEGNFYSDYTQFLDKDGLKGKRIGLYKISLGNHYKVDEVVDQAVEYLKSQGVEIVEIENIFTSNVNSLSFEVMLYEYKDGLNKYFASLGEDAPIKNLRELIAFNINDSIELDFYNQEYLEMALGKGGLESEEYKDALAKMMKGSQEVGMDRVMDMYKLDAIIAPTGGPAWKTDHINGDAFQVGSSSPAAISGYPNITVPMGFIDELPVGLSFFGRAWSEPILIEIAYAFEQGTMHRRAPKFLEP